MSDSTNREPYKEHSLIGSAASSGSLQRALEDLARRGFTQQFTAAGEGLRAEPSGETFAPADLVIQEHHRFEGTSDPDDMSVVYAIESRSGTRGTLVDAYGTYADPTVSAILEQIPARGGPTD